MWLAPGSGRLILGITLNDAYAGSVEASDFLVGIDTVPSQDMQLIIHSLLGHDPEWIVALSRQCTGRATVFWTHDHTAICPSFTLQRNDVFSCDGPALGSRQCELCVYGEEREGHFKRVSALLRQINPIVVSPSEFSNHYFKERVPGAYRTAVVEHCALTAKRRAIARDGAIRVAFVGTPVRHKGWRQFVDLVDRFGTQDEYQFSVFGPAATELASVASHYPVSVIRDGRMAMVQALRREDVDLAFLWSTWKETFCVSAYEAVAAGCMILTNPGAGNITSLVRRESCGAIFDDFADICEAFADGRISALASRRRRDASIFDLRFSRMTIDAREDGIAVA